MRSLIRYYVYLCLIKQKKNNFSVSQAFNRSGKKQQKKKEVI